ncbi:hypothetical protein ACLIN3_15475 [Pseudomonas orientalis]|uniref:hypothetical protein n=1 Tax=Pseudomonas orientalis TaxID=76758 RepID=UPI0039856F38
MTMLDNAVSSIRLGIEDFKQIGTDEARALSAIRNLSAGLLLMFKVKLQELSPPDSKEALLKQFLTPSLDAAGKPVWVGKGNKTVDVETIIQRLDALGVAGIDWKLLRKLTEMRNDVEHYYSKQPASVLAEAMAASFHLIQQFVPTYLNRTPAQLLGQELWTLLTAEEAFFTREYEVCKTANAQVPWGHEFLEGSIDLLQCSTCKSTLIRPLEQRELKSEIVFVCTHCSAETRFAEAVEMIATTHYFPDLYYSMTKGGEPPVEHCPRCGHFSYLTEELMCVLCLDETPKAACAECSRPLETEIDPDDDLTRLCGLCYYSSEAD